MTVTKVVTEEQTSGALPQLNVADLKTVKWVGDTHYFQQAYQSSLNRYNHYRNWPILRWIFAVVELVVLSIAMFIQQLPWPEKVVTWVYKIDNMIEKGLNVTYNKLDWWWDIFMVRSIRLRDSLENLIDGILSFGFYCILLLGNLWECYVSFFKLTLIPYIWLYRIITLGPKHPTGPPKVKQENNQETNGQSDDSKIRSTEDVTESSDYESDVSAVSESWSLGHSVKNGHTYNRVDTKVTAEGKLRALMQKRVETQLGVMRKHSARLSLGLASYIKEFWEPKMRPAVEAVYERIHKYAMMFGLMNVLEYARKKISSYPFIERQLILMVYLMVFPINVYSGLTKRTKSRRSRSVRSESLRRRLVTENVKPLVPLLPTDRNRSAEIIKEERHNSCMNKFCDETDSNYNRDSAITSSMDDIATSDSNDTSLRRAKNDKTRNHDGEIMNGVPELKLRIDEDQEYYTGSVKDNSKMPNNTTGSRSPQLPRIKLNFAKDEIPDTAFLLSPRHRRRNRNMKLRSEHREFLSQEHMTVSQDNASDTSNGRGFESSSSMLRRKKSDKKRKISFTL